VTLKVCKTIADLRATVRRTQKSALVPTMGNLHSGHIGLVRQVKPFADVTVATIFVNRLQFSPHEDFDKYPRTFEADCEKLEAAGCDVLFAPNEAQMYPQPQTYKVHPPPELANILEGEFRPGFYVGVSTVVMKLFTIAQPDVAIFGKKDYQQLMVIRSMVQQFAMPIEIIAGETERAADGLALSSRNGYLSAQERAEAPRLHATLTRARDRVLAGVPIATVEAEAMQSLRDAGWQPDYVVVRARKALEPFLVPTPQIASHAVALAAAKLGKTRLIDQLEF
jgi:pantoate--beta-alanine ligase